MSDKVKDSNTQKIELQVKGNDLTFIVTRDKYNKYLNSVTPDNKVGPSHNFLVSVIDESCEETLLTILSTNPGSEVPLMTAIVSAYVPDLGIVVKKPM